MKKLVPLGLSSRQWIPFSFSTSKRGVLFSANSTNHMVAQLSIADFLILTRSPTFMILPQNAWLIANALRGNVVRAWYP
jgi:hypothetical protein